MTWWEILVAIAGALGGIDLLKWLANVIGNRKNNARIADAEADRSEFHILQEEVEFLQGQLKEKEERFADQTGLLRQVQRELLALEKEKSIAEVEAIRKISELEILIATVRCDEHDCPFRQPPTAHTPPMKGLTIEQYFEKKQCNKKQYETS